MQTHASQGWRLLCALPSLFVALALRFYHWSVHTLQALCVAYCVGRIALGHGIWQKCLYKQSSWSADSDIWFGIKQSVASHLLSYARVLERLGFYRYCPITLSGIWKIGISLDICHWNCCPNPKGPFRFWHQNPNKGGRRVLSFFTLLLIQNLAVICTTLWDPRVLAWQSLTTVHAPAYMKVCTDCSSRVSWCLVESTLLWLVPDDSAETPAVSATSAASVSGTWMDPSRNVQR